MTQGYDELGGKCLNDFVLGRYSNNLTFVDSGG